MRPIGLCEGKSYETDISIGTQWLTPDGAFALRFIQSKLGQHLPAHDPQRIPDTWYVLKLTPTPIGSAWAVVSEHPRRYQAEAALATVWTPQPYKPEETMEADDKAATLAKIAPPGLPSRAADLLYRIYYAGCLELTGPLLSIAKPLIAQKLIVVSGSLATMVPSLKREAPPPAPEQPPSTMEAVNRALRERVKVAIQRVLFFARQDAPALAEMGFDLNKRAELLEFVLDADRITACLDDKHAIDFLHALTFDQRQALVESLIDGKPAPDIRAEPKAKRARKPKPEPETVPEVPAPPPAVENKPPRVPRKLATREPRVDMKRFKVYRVGGSYLPILASDATPHAWLSRAKLVGEFDAADGIAAKEAARVVDASRKSL